MQQPPARLLRAVDEVRHRLRICWGSPTGGGPAATGDPGRGAAPVLALAAPGPQRPQPDQRRHLTALSRTPLADLELPRPGSSPRGYSRVLADSKRGVVRLEKLLVLWENGETLLAVQTPICLPLTAIRVQVIHV